MLKHWKLILASLVVAVALHVVTKKPASKAAAVVRKLYWTPLTQLVSCESMEQLSSGLVNLKGCIRPGDPMETKADIYALAQVLDLTEENNE